MIRLVFVLALAFSCDTAVAAADLDKIASSEGWKRLVHYHRTIPFWSWRSRLDGAGFFLSPEGRDNPKAELLATIDAAEKEELEIGPLKQSPRCAFPARYDFLLESGVLLPKQLKPCAKLEEFLRRFNAESTTLVFSTAYPNNPGSMFGHVFLRVNQRVNRSIEQKKLDILDFGISYAAAVGDENGFEFAIRGMAGGYEGHFLMVPYYEKINEYTNAESRDIWEYDLAMTPAQTERLLKHTWELETTGFFDYFFIDENCAYQLLALLEVARPDWTLSDFPIYVIPSEAVKHVVDTPGAVTKIKFRPSLQKKMIQAYEAISLEEREKMLDLVRGSAPVSSIQEPSTLQALVSYLHYEKQKADGKLSPDYEARLSDALVRISELPQAQTHSLPPIDESSRPDLGHYPLRLSLAGGVASQGRSFEELAIKSAYHDLMNSDLGYVPFSQIDFPGIAFRRFNQDSGFHVEQATGLAITSIFPLSFVEKRFSWSVIADYYTPKDFECPSCHAARIQGGAGAAIPLFSKNAVIYGLAMGKAEFGSSFEAGYRWGPLVRAAVLFNPVAAYKTQLLGDWVFDLLQNTRQRSHFRIEWDNSFSFNRAWEVRASVTDWLPTRSTERSYVEGKLTLNRYF